MAYASEDQAHKVLQVVLGLDEYNNKDGERIGFTLREQRSHQSWRSKPTGKFYITVNSLYIGRRGVQARDKVFKTKLSLNNEFDTDEITAYIDRLLEVRAQKRIEDAITKDFKASNLARVERVKAAYKGNRHIIDYNSTYSYASLLPSGDRDDAIGVRWDMTLTEAEAIKFMEFLNSIGR